MQQRRNRRGDRRWRQGRSLPRRRQPGRDQQRLDQEYPRAGSPTGSEAERPTTRLARLGRVAAVLAALAFGPYCGYIGVKALVMDVMLAGDGPVAQAVVVRQGGQAKGQVLSVVETFTTASGQQVEVDVDQFHRPVPQPGDVRALRYDPDHPTWCVREVAHGAEYADPLIFIPLGLLIIAYPVSEIYPAARRVSRRVRAARRGRLDAGPAQPVES